MSKSEIKIQFQWKSETLKSLELRRKIFFWFLGISAFTLLCISLYFHNRLLAFGVILSSAIVYSLKKVEPQELPVEVSNKGIKVYNSLSKYKKIMHFWIIDNYDKSYLLFISKRNAIYLTNVISIESDINVDELRDYLLGFIEEKEIDESFINMIMD